MKDTCKVTASFDLYRPDIRGNRLLSVTMAFDPTLWDQVFPYVTQTMNRRLIDAAHEVNAQLPQEDSDELH